MRLVRAKSALAIEAVVVATAATAAAVAAVDINEF
jgi:hypothetical protein